MDRVLVLLIGAPLGLLIVVYRYHLKQFTGDIAFAEQYLGGGGTYNLFALIGIAVFVFSLMYAFGALQDVYLGTFGRLFAH